MAEKSTNVVKPSKNFITNVIKKVFDIFYSAEEFSSIKS